MIETKIQNAILEGGGVYTEKPKQCFWCYKLIYNYQKKFGEGTRRSGKYFCTLDCTDEYRDWSRITSYKKQLVKQKKDRDNKKKPKVYIALDRKEYYKKYDEQRKAKKKEYYLKVAKLKRNNK